MNKVCEETGDDTVEKRTEGGKEKNEKPQPIPRVMWAREEVKKWQVKREVERTYWTRDAHENPCKKLESQCNQEPSPKDRSIGATFRFLFFQFRMVAREFHFRWWVNGIGLVEFVHQTIRKKSQLDCVLLGWFPDVQVPEYGHHHHISKKQDDGPQHLLILFDLFRIEQEINVKKEQPPTQKDYGKVHDHNERKETASWIAASNQGKNHYGKEKEDIQEWQYREEANHQSLGL